MVYLSTLIVLCFSTFSSLKNMTCDICSYFIKVHSTHLFYPRDATIRSCFKEGSKIRCSLCLSKCITKQVHSY
uniref:Putative secreted peptide n=1 Tax=Anopheles braziliensis TaxID=58242 RepID=A0A2M3ZXF1_9DIPT